jgi:hypothetical protein
MRRRHQVLIATSACAAVISIVSAPGAKADRLVPVPAPPASGSAVAAQVGSLVDVSRTGATADSDTASSDASVVRITEEPLLGLGGTQQGDGQTGGALLDTQSTLPARVQLAPWAASASGTGTGTRHSNSSAAVARADVPDVAQAGVLTSESEATHTDQQSNGTAITDGFQLGVLNAIRLVLLHSEVSSDGVGHSYLLGLNGMELGTDEQLGATPLCALSAPGLLSLSCLSSSGGTGSAGPVSEAASQVAEITPALDALGIIDPVAAFTSTATAGTGEQAAAAAPAAAAPVSTETSRSTAPEAVAGAGTSALPRTGATIASLLASAVALLLFGLALRRFRLRPATVMGT